MWCGSVLGQEGGTVRSPKRSLRALASRPEASADRWAYVNWPRVLDTWGSLKPESHKGQFLSSLVEGYQHRALRLSLECSNVVLGTTFKVPSSYYSDNSFVLVTEKSELSEAGSVVYHSLPWDWLCILQELHYSKSHKVVFKLHKIVSPLFLIVREISYARVGIVVKI